MQMIDFEYSGERLSDHGMTVCSFDGYPETVQDSGNNIELNTIKASNSNEYINTGYTYSDTFTVEFQVIKTGCSVVDEYITDVELNKLMRWLNRKKYCVFRPIYADDNFMNIYYKGFFNIKLIKSGKDVIGLDLTFVSNAPFGFMNPTTYTYEFKNQKDKFIIHDISDEVGMLYCETKIKCLEAGDLKISNTLDPDNDIIIKNCAVNEVISLHGKTKIIETSSIEHVNICSDFNYNFLRVINTYYDVENIFTSSIRCKITVSYSPIRKVGIVL